MSRLRRTGLPIDDPLAAALTATNVSETGPDEVESAATAASSLASTAMPSRSKKTAARRPSSTPGAAAPRPATRPAAAVAAVNARSDELWRSWSGQTRVATYRLPDELLAELGAAATQAPPPNRPPGHRRDRAPPGPPGRGDRTTRRPSRRHPHPGTTRGTTSAATSVLNSVGVVGMTHSVAAVRRACRRAIRRASCRRRGVSRWSSTRTTQAISPFCDGRARTCRRHSVARSEWLSARSWRLKGSAGVAAVTARCSVIAVRRASSGLWSGVMSTDLGAVERDWGGAAGVAPGEDPRANAKCGGSQRSPVRSSRRRSARTVQPGSRRRTRPPSS
jgi:hypothetical protein